MSDFADLWNSVTPTSNAAKKSAGNETLASQLNTSRSNGPGATSQPISRVSTPSYFSSQGISPQLSGQAQRTSPRPGSTGPTAKPGASSNPGDAFGDLFSLSGASQSKNMTIAERQALANREQARVEEQKRKEREAHGAFWDQLEFSSPTGSTARTDQNSTGLLTVSPPPFVPRIETTLTPSRAAPLPSSKPNTSAVTSASHADVWDLDSFLAPNKPASRAPTPSSAISPGPKREQTNATLFDLLDSAPSGNQVVPDSSSKDTPVRSGTPGDFDWGNREDDEDDLLGDLGKPVSQRPSKPPTPTPPNDHYAGEPREPVRVARQGSPPPHIIGQIVEMGFSVKEAKRALANTATGTDVQAALDSLLAGGTTSGAADHGLSANDLERFREEDEAARWEHEEAERRRRRRAGPSRSPAPEPASDDTSRQLQEKADQLLAQASMFGTSMFNRANALWKEGKDKAMKAYEDHTAASPSASSGRSRDTGRPAWMQDEPSPSTERRNMDIPEHSRFRDDDDDSTLPPPAAPRPSRPSATRQPSQPTIVTTAPTRPADKIASLFSDTPTYVSPARRKAPSQTSTPVRSSPAVERIAPAPIVLRTRPNPPVSADTLSAVQSHRTKGTEAFKLGQYGAAADSYTAALQLLPEGHLTRIPLLNNRAAARSKTGDASGAIEDCTLVLDVIGDDFDPAKETPIPDVDLGGALVKALRRRAETLESTEKWKRAREDWERLAKEGGTWAGSKTSSEGVQGAGRCKRMEEGGDSSASKPRAPAASTKPKPKPRPVPPKSTTPQPNSAVHRLKTANAAAEAEDDKKHSLKDTVDARIMAWKGGKENNIRALIASLDTVLWPELGWVKVGMHELVMPNQVKIKYVRAIAKVHPDKLNSNSTTIEQRMIANSVFGALNEAWNAFDQ